MSVPESECEGCEKRNEVLLCSICESHWCFNCLTFWRNRNDYYDTYNEIELTESEEEFTCIYCFIDIVHD